jgi:uncharacterized CHY-type Zn-finger protein
MSKPIKSKTTLQKESHKETIARIAAENRAYYESVERHSASNSTQEKRTASNADSRTFTCPHCGNNCLVSADLLNTDVNCPHCSNIFNAECQPIPPRQTIPSQPKQNSQSANLTATQFAILENSIKGKLNSVVVQNIRLVHLGESRYKAHLTIMTAHGNEQRVADVNFDGDNFVWQIVDESARGTLGFRIVGLITLLFCAWMWYLTFDEYHNGELVTATAKYLSVLHTTDLPNSPEITQVQQKMDVLRWKGFLIEQGWWFGCLVGFAQLFSGRSFSDFPWGRMIIVWFVGLIIFVIQSL